MNIGWAQKAPSFNRPDGECPVKELWTFVLHLNCVFGGSFSQLTN
jgi:hypothetical protein